MRAQVAFEYMSISAFALIIIVTILYTALHVQQDTVESESQQALKKIADTIQQEILLAASVHDGYSREFYVEQDAAGKAYTIDSYETGFGLLMSGYSESRKTPPFTGNITTGTNTITKNNGTIRFI